MRIVFMGSAELACPCLRALLEMPGQDVVTVVTQPDRPKGRNLQPSPPPVKLVAQKYNVPVNQPLKVRDPAAVETLKLAKPDLIVVVAYGQILPAAVLKIPPLGCVNVHTSLLPRWRGAAPIQHAILHGDKETGVTTMYMDEQMDTGDMILQSTEPIRPDDTSATLHDRLAAKGTALLVETVRLIAVGQAPRRKQYPAHATYARKLAKEDGRLDWTQPAVELERQVRAFNPWPSAYTFAGETQVKIWKADVVCDVTGRPGEVLPGLVVAAGEGGLRILELQPAGGKRMTADAFLRGRAIGPGTVFG